METFTLAPGLTEEIIAHARSGGDQEVCGVVAGREDLGLILYRGRNVSATPRVAFEMDVETLARQIDFEDQGMTLAAIYHSHPRGPAMPSPTDIAQAYYPDTVTLICSLADPARPSLRGFRIADGRVREVQLI